MLDIKRKWWIFITLVCFKCRLHIVLGLIQISTDLPKFSLWTIFFPFLPSHHTIRSVNYEVTNVTKQYWIYIPFQLTQSIKFTWFRRHFFVIFFSRFCFSLKDWIDTICWIRLTVLPYFLCFRSLHNATQWVSVTIRKFDIVSNPLVQSNYHFD